MSIHTNDNGQMVGPLTHLREELTNAQTLLTEAREALAQSRRETAEAVKLHEDFVVKASDILAEGANDHDLCGAYDEWAERAGLLPRPFPQDVEVEVTYRQTITIRARNYREAVNKASQMPEASSRYFNPINPFQTHDDITDVGGAYSLSVKVVDAAEVEPF